MENEQIFKQAGLTVNESKVYETLVKHGRLGSTGISSKSGVPYGRIYSVLNSLIEKGLVMVLPEKTKRYKVTSPEELIKLIDEKQNELSEAREKAKDLKKFYDQRDAEVAQVAYGDKGFWKLVYQTAKSTEFSYGIRYLTDMRADPKENVRKNVKKGIDVKNLVRYDDETKRNVHELLKISDNVRELENEGVAMGIDEKTVLIGLIKSNTTILVKDKSFAKLMKKMFSETYKNSPKIKKTSTKK